VVRGYSPVKVQFVLAEGVVGGVFVGVRLFVVCCTLDRCAAVCRKYEGWAAAVDDLALLLLAVGETRDRVFVPAFAGGGDLKSLALMLATVGLPSTDENEDFENSYCSF
jgi:hypothetical protein